MNCVVFGGGGFIGSHLSEELLHQRHKVSIFDQDMAPNLDLLAKEGANIIIGNLLSEHEIRNAIRGVDILFHLISSTVPKSSNDDPIFDIETNLVGTINLLNAARDNGVKKVIFASSGGTVYGKPMEIPIKESHPTNPISSYGVIKLAIEKYIYLYQELFGLDYGVLRISNAYGERQRPTGIQGVISTLMLRALKEDEIVIWGDGNVVRDYIHITDIVNAFIKIMNYDGESKIYNIGSGIGHSVNEIIKTFEEIFERKLNINFQPGRPYDVPINILDNSLARLNLNWEPKTDLIDGISKMHQYFKTLL